MFLIEALKYFEGFWTVLFTFGDAGCHENGTVGSGWKVDLVVNLRIIGVVDDKEPVLPRSGEDCDGFVAVFHWLA